MPITASRRKRGILVLHYYWSELELINTCETPTADSFDPFEWMMSVPIPAEDKSQMLVGFCPVWKGFTEVVSQYSTSASLKMGILVF